MKIEEGKFYRTRDGRKAGPMKRWGGGWIDASRTRGDMWQDDGLRYYSENRGDDDLIAEWTDGPVREVTRKEIVPGTYGRIQVSHNYDRIGDEAFDPQAVINLTARDGSMMDRGNFSAAELRSAASTLTAIADALEETK